MIILEGGWFLLNSNSHHFGLESRNVLSLAIGSEWGDATFPAITYRSYLVEVKRDGTRSR